jgi:uncharacterized protein (TIGR03382 family)
MACNTVMGTCNPVQDGGVGVGEACPEGTLYSPVVGDCVYGETVPADTEGEVESACGGAGSTGALAWLLALAALIVIRRRG